MAVTTPVGYNPSLSPITGTTQVGTLAVGATAQEYSRKPGGITYWMSPDQTLGYVIAKPIPGGNQSTRPAIGATSAYVGFSRSASSTDSSFVGLVNQIAAGATAFSSTQASQAKTWLNNNGYWTSYNSIVTTNLILNLDATNTSSYSGSGSTWYDISGSGNNFTLVNSPSYSSNFNGYITFDDLSSQYGTGPNVGNLSTWTVEVWFRASKSLSGKVTSLLTNVYDLSTKLNFSVGTNNSPGSYNLTAGYFDGSWHSTTGSSISTNTWYQVVGTYNGSTISYYINGSLVNSLNYTGTPQSGGGLRLARRWDDVVSAGNLFAGDISVVRLYSTGLNSTQVSQNFSSCRYRYSL